LNKIEQIKSEKDGLDVGADIPRFAELGVAAIPEGDLERLKWWGVFGRKHTPGHFMMRIRIPNGLSRAVQLRTLGALANEYGRGLADITTRQQLQLRWLTIAQIPAVLERLQAVGLVTLQDPARWTTGGVVALSRAATAPPGRPERLGGMGGHVGAPHVTSCAGAGRADARRRRASP